MGIGNTRKIITLSPSPPTLSLRGASCRCTPVVMSQGTSDEPVIDSVKQSAPQSNSQVKSKKNDLTSTEVDLLTLPPLFKLPL